MREGAGTGRGSKIQGGKKLQNVMEGADGERGSKIRGGNGSRMWGRRADSEESVQNTGARMRYKI